jgi:hypothetical protein
MYRSDHIKVLRVLASGLPKRRIFRTNFIVDEAFTYVESGDRCVRNAYRKLRKEGHIEIVERGKYRLTTSGAALCRRLQKYDWDIVREFKERKPPKRRKKK